MNKKVLMVVTLGILSAAVIGLVIYSVFADSQINSYKNEIYARANGAFEEVVEQVSGFNTKLQKVSVSNDTEKTQELLMDLWRDAGSAQVSVTDLSMNEDVKEKLVNYFNTTGDYVKQLANNLKTGKALADSDKEQLKQIKNTCAQLHQKLMDAWNQGYVADINLDEFIPEGQENAQTIDFANQNYPRLIYDGPFSESIMNKKPQNLPNNTVNEQQGLEAAKKFSGISELKLNNQSDGDIPYYDYEGQTEGKNVTVSVTKQGGQILYYFCDTGEGGLTILASDQREQEIIDKAKTYLTQKNYPECAASYVQYYDGNALVNMVPLEKGKVLLYPDLIKVWVNMSTEEIVGLDTRNYLMSHKARTLAEPKLSIYEARDKVSKNLTVKKMAEAIIPLETGKEAYCYEFTCTEGATDCIVYIDTQTGKEVDILSIIHTNNGTLTQ